MGKQIKAGEKLPFFKYDTPYSAANSFRQLLAEHAPLVLVFMSNFGHPITRTFVGRYAATYDELTGGSLALVVRSRADRLARSVGPDTLPYPLLCDADGVLYDLLDIPTRSGALSTYSLEAWQIMRDAKRRGYHSPANGQQQLPLTLVLDKDGTVLFQPDRCSGGLRCGPVLVGRSGRSQAGRCGRCRCDHLCGPRRSAGYSRPDSACT